MKAIWKDTVIAESDKTIEIEGYDYFPPDSVRREYLQPSNAHSICAWKGEASYYNVVVNSEVNKDAAWYYPNTKEAAKNIENYIAFWKGVQVTQ